jgi:predicted MPP superfamily phosphohydrolase
MAENTCLKEISAEVKKNIESLERSNADLQAQIERLDDANQARFERMETIQMNNESQFIQINSALDQLLERLQTILISHHGGTSSTKEHNQNMIQVRTVKLDFPRFDGKKVMDWIF